MFIHSAQTSVNRNSSIETINRGFFNDMFLSPPSFSKLVLDFASGNEYMLYLLSYDIHHISIDI